MNLSFFPEPIKDEKVSAKFVASNSCKSFNSMLKRAEKLNQEFGLLHSGAFNHNDVAIVNQLSKLTLDQAKQCCDKRGSQKPSNLLKSSAISIYTLPLCLLTTELMTQSWLKSILPSILARPTEIQKRWPLLDHLQKTLTLISKEGLLSFVKTPFQVDRVYHIKDRRSKCLKNRPGGT